MTEQFATARDQYVDVVVTQLFPAADRGDLARPVEAIQGDTAAAVTAIEDISAIVAPIRHRQTTIANAVEEQTATTTEMGRSVTEAAGGTTEIAANITGVWAAAESTTQAVGQTPHRGGRAVADGGRPRSAVSRFQY